MKNMFFGSSFFKMKIGYISNFQWIKYLCKALSHLEKLTYRAEGARKNAPPENCPPPQENCLPLPLKKEFCKASSCYGIS